MPVNNRKEIDNPCLKEQEMSYKCLSDNNYDQKACEVFFENFKRCKGFWNKVKWDRRAKGIRPHMPPVEMRAKIKEEYLSQKPE